MNRLARKIDGAKQRILQGDKAVLVTVEGTAGSVPRETDAAMLVLEDALVGTIGGGALEFAALHRARAILSGEASMLREETVPLGPAIGQCCGGAVTLGYRMIDADDLSSVDDWRGRIAGSVMPVWLFGAGHVGRAVAQALAALPFHLTWIDSRAEAFPAAMDAVDFRVSRAPALEVEHIPAAGTVLVMTHSHALDFDIIDAALRRGNLGFVGLIGSATKRARFVSRLRARGHGENAIQGLTCPIGVAGITGKEPEIIAASVVAQLLQAREAGTAMVPVPVSLAG